jgi:hypothetical protein
MRTLIHKSLVLKKGDVILKEYDFKGKPKKIAFEINKILTIQNKRGIGKFKVVGFGRCRRKVEIQKLHAKKGYMVSAIVWYSDNPRFDVFDDTDDYVEKHIPIMFQRIKYGTARFYLLDESEALLYRGL